ncbi:MucR family transcriptional regulator [Methylobacterium soli]|uniref:MucR family transcriptional regulator n=1 Tax=Methylobacterium soli TaxID=553447 RepID=A0A6L3T2D0_9HYPH|nr:MucR family transcriptional regulator [Methylobacterium soli]KAB1080892.1 MucR family transcriptional regulator [Methylobacterium soli]GJE46359.1 hypothetical protein AEGHOMDF_5562 [Methylobacterium soli]
MAADIVKHDRLVTLAIEIVMAYVTRNHVQATELSGLLRDVHAGLLRLSSGSAEPTEVRRTLTAAEIRRSIRPEGLVSFEDGKAYKTLRRHLTKLGLTPDAYRAKWGLPADYPMTASAYSAQRSQLALDRGLGRSRSLPFGTAEVEADEAVVSGAQMAADMPEQADAPDASDEGITREPFEDDGAAS